MNLKLNERNSEIAEKIPRNIRSIVLNAILAKSIENGMLAEELSYHLSSAKVQEIIESLAIGIRISIDKPKMSKKRAYTVEKKKEVKRKMHTKTSVDNDNMDIFAGFDD